MNTSVKYTEVFFAGSEKFPTKEVVRGVQVAAAEGGHTRDTAMGVASLDSEGLYRVEHHDHRVIWVLAGADSLKKRLLVFAHLEGFEHRGIDVTMAQLEQHCVWDRGKTLPHFTVGDYNLVGGVSRQGKRRKLMSTWTELWRVANDDKEHVYAVQNLVTPELRDVHVARMNDVHVVRMRFTPMTSSRSPASSASFPTIGEPGRVPHPDHLCYQAGFKRRRVRCQGGLGRTGGGGAHLGAGVARVA